MIASTSDHYRIRRLVERLVPAGYHLARLLGLHLCDSRHTEGVSN